MFMKFSVESEQVSCLIFASQHFWSVRFWCQYHFLKNRHISEMECYAICPDMLNMHMDLKIKLCCRPVATIKDFSFISKLGWWLILLKFSSSLALLRETLAYYFCTLNQNYSISALYMQPKMLICAWFMKSHQLLLWTKITPHQWTNLTSSDSLQCIERGVSVHWYF